MSEYGRDGGSSVMSSVNSQSYKFRGSAVSCSMFLIMLGRPSKKDVRESLRWMKPQTLLRISPWNVVIFGKWDGSLSES